MKKTFFRQTSVRFSGRVQALSKGKHPALADINIFVKSRQKSVETRLLTSPIDMLFGLVVGFAACLVSIHGHGYLIDPPARSSAWMVDSAFKQCCTYPSHMEMYCGGLQHQWSVNSTLTNQCDDESPHLIVLRFQRDDAVSVVNRTIVKTNCSPKVVRCIWERLLRRTLKANKSK